MAEHPVTTWKNRAERAERKNGQTRVLSLSVLRRLATQIASGPEGSYRWFIGELRRQKRSLRLGKPVKRVVRSSVRRDSQDVKWSKAIRARDANCQWCLLEHPKDGEIRPSAEAAHILSRRFQATRRLLENGVGLCRSHHLYGTEHPKEWEAIARRLIGDAEYDRLWKLAHRVKE